jgi:SNF2 family DNA or RNA helicase
MLRTRRAESGVPFSERHVQTHRIPSTPAEDAIYEAVTEYLVRSYRARLDTGDANRGVLIREAMSLQQSLSSGPQALAVALESRASNRPAESGLLRDLAAETRALRGSKELLLTRVLDGIGDEPAVIFTIRLETLHRLVGILADAGAEALPYHGSMSRAERDRNVERFTHGPARFLVATDAGAEGLNLQARCNLVVNYDLHWNPMKLEQRIGRVHRFGQERAVTVFNLAVQDTVDDHVLRILTEKLHLFTSVVGEVEDVLAEIEEGEGDFEQLIMEIVLRARDRSDLAERMKRFEQDVADGYERASLAREFTAGVLG